MKATNYRNMRKQIHKDNFMNLRRYVDKIVSSNRMYESSMMKKFRKMSSWVYDFRPSQWEYYERKEEEVYRKMALKRNIINTAFFVLLAVFGYEMYNWLLPKLQNSTLATYFQPIDDIFMSEIKKNKMKNNPADLDYLWERLAGVKNIHII